MKKFAFALVALATALAISPAAKADSITIGSGFQVGGTIVQDGNQNTTTPTLSNVTAFGGYLSFADVTGSSTLTYTLVPGIVGDTFTVNTTDGQTITFTVSTVGLTSNGEGGVGWLTDTGTINYDPTLVAWSEAITITDAGIINETFTFNDVATTPEPSSLLLLGTGLLGLAFALFRKNKTVGLVLR